MQIILTKKIPEGWKMVKMSEIANISAGGTPSTKKIEYWGGDIPWMNSGDLNKRIIYKVDGKITKLGMDSSSAKIVPINSVLIGLAGQGKTRGTVAINKIELTTNQSVAFFIPNNINYKFLYFNLYRKYLELRNLSAGDGGRGGLNLQILKNIKLLTPSLSEQNRIVEVLETWDKYLEKLDQKIKIKKNIKKGLMQNLLTGKKRLCGFDDKWQEKNIGKIIIPQQKTNRMSGSSLNTGKYPFFNNSSKNFDQYVDDYDFNGEMIIANTGGIAYFDYYLGKFAVMSDCFVFSTKESCKFLFYILKFFEFKINNKGFTGSGIKHLDKKFFFKFKIKLPSLKEQIVIANILTVIDKEIETLEKQREIIKNQKKYLLNNLITGQIRLPEFVNKN